ncbi:MAG: glycosyltransferase [Comamonadaceae bacterium]|nr:MAG: glycosyltransferase [Comamonadaceae bacterium]
MTAGATRGGQRTLTVLHVITKGDVGGAQTHVRTLCKALLATGRVMPMVAIGGAEAGSPLAMALQEDGIPVLSLTALGNRSSPLDLWRAMRALQRQLHAHRIDLLHAHSAAAGVAARIAGALARVPVVYTVHGFAFKRGARWLRRVPAFMVESALAPLTRQLVCVSTHEAHLARCLPIARQRICVVPNGVNDCAERAQPERTPPRIAMVARLAAPKRPDLLLQALAQVRDALGYEIAATFMGDGPLRSDLAAQAARLGLAQIDFTGDVSDVSQRLAAHSISVLMSDHEGMPLAVIEAMRAGLAIVASDLPGTQELLPTAEQGLRVPNQTQALASALLALVASPELRASMGAAARARYERAHAPATMAAGVVAAYERALA